MTNPPTLESAPRSEPPIIFRDLISPVSRFSEAIILMEAVRLLEVRRHSDPLLGAALEVFKPVIVKHVDIILNLGIHEYQTAKQKNSDPPIG